MNTETYLNRMKQLHESAQEITSKKVKDYGIEADPFSNFRMCEQYGVCPVEVGIFVRMSDKMTRIANLLHKEPDVADETIQDTLKDLSNYALILLLWIESQTKKAKRRGRT